MAKSNSATFLSVLLLFVLLLSFNPGGTLKTVNGEQVSEQKTWCMAKSSTDPIALQKIINFVCSENDCSIVNYGGPCFEPDTLINHASVLMNLYYQKNGRHPWNCVFKGNGVTALTDPSYGSCKYE